MYLDASNLYGWAKSQKPPVNEIKWLKMLSKFDDCFLKSYDENTDKGYFLEVDVEYPKKMFNLHSNLPFLPERKEIKKFNKLVYNIHDKKKLCHSDKSFRTSIKS